MRPFGRSRALDDLVELATVELDATALWAIVDFDTTAVSHDKGFTIYGALLHKSREGFIL